MKEALWKSIYNGKYSISTNGEVISHKPSGDKIIYQYKHKNGFCEVSLCENGTAKRYAVHKLMALHFLPNPYGYKNVVHKNGNVSDNHLENLEWSNSMDNH